MNLAIDMGNTRMKVAFFEGDDLVSTKTLNSSALESFKELFPNNSIGHVIVSSVVGIDQQAEEFIRSKASLIILTEHTPLPVKNLYKSSDTLGKDRLAGVVGAFALYPGENVLVIDSGTCITYDFLNKKGEFIGGGISPGLGIRFKALNNYTKSLPFLETREIDYFIGTDTKESILSGVINGVATELDGMIQKYQDNYPDLKIIITGGDSKFLVSYIKSNIFAVPDLVLSGLNKILQHNAS